MSEPPNSNREQLDAPLAERERLEKKLLAAIKRERAALEALLESMSGHWGYEDTVYRFYHQSWKVYHQAQQPTERATELFRSLLPGRPLNSWF